LKRRPRFGYRRLCALLVGVGFGLVHRPRESVCHTCYSNFADKVVDGDRDAALNKLAKTEERIVRQMERKPTAKGE